MSDTDLRQPASPAALFWVFAKMAMQGFGGVLPIAQHTLCERERWMTKQQFAELFSISQVLPGPNVVNLTLVIGDRYFGWRGALAALAGMVGVPLIVVLVLAAAYNQLAQHAAAAGAMRGMGAAAAGLVLGMVFKLMPALKGNVNGPWITTGVVVLSVLAVAVMRWPMAYVVLGVGGISCCIAWWRLGRDA